MNNYSHIQTLSFENRTGRRTGKTIKTTRRDACAKYDSTHAEFAEVIQLIRGQVGVTIDWKKLLNNLGRKALLSKGGKAQICNGIVKVKRLSGGVENETIVISPLREGQEYIGGAS